MKLYQKILLVLAVMAISIIWIILTTEKKEATPAPPAVEQTEPEPVLPKDPKGEKILLMTLPTQDTTVVFKLDLGDVIKMSEIRNETNAVLIWTSDNRNFYQIILRDKYPNWEPGVDGGVFKLKNGKKLTVRFE